MPVQRRAPAGKPAFPTTSGMHWHLVKPDGRPADVVAFEEAVIAFFLDSATLLGIPKSVAAIYGICFASPEPLSFSDINDRLDISSGSISQGLRILKEVGALKVAETGRAVERSNGRADVKASKPVDLSNRGSEAVQPIDGASVRQALARSAARYEPDLELRKLVLHWIEKRLQGQLTSGRDRLQQIVASIPQASGASETLNARFESLQTWHEKARALLPVAKAFLKLN